MFHSAQPFLLSERTSKLFYSVAGAFLLFLIAQINIPLKPVPITLQTVGVMLIALTFDQKSALYAISLYLALGALGAPIFANGQGGLPVLLGPTGGYLLGFLAAALVMSTLKEYLNSKNFFHTALNCLIGTIVIFTFGLGWLVKFVGLTAVIQVGLLPFILPGLIKILLLAAAMKGIRTK